MYIYIYIYTHIICLFIIYLFIYLFTSANARARYVTLADVLPCQTMMITVYTPGRIAISRIPSVCFNDLSTVVLMFDASICFQIHKCKQVWAPSACSCFDSNTCLLLKGTSLTLYIFVGIRPYHIYSHVYVLYTVYTDTQLKYNTHMHVCMNTCYSKAHLYTCGDNRP